VLNLAANKKTVSFLIMFFFVVQVSCAFAQTPPPVPAKPQTTQQSPAITGQQPIAPPTDGTTTRPTFTAYTGSKTSGNPASTTPTGTTTSASPNASVSGIPIGQSGTDEL